MGTHIAREAFADRGPRRQHKGDLSVRPFAARDQAIGRHADPQTFSSGHRKATGDRALHRPGPFRDREGKRSAVAVWVGDEAEVWAGGFGDPSELGHEWLVVRPPRPRERWERVVVMGRHEHLRPGGADVRRGVLEPVCDLVELPDASDLHVDVRQLTQGVPDLARPRLAGVGDRSARVVPEQRELPDPEHVGERRPGILGGVVGEVREALGGRV